MVAPVGPHRHRTTVLRCLRGRNGYSIRRLTRCFSAANAAVHGSLIVLRRTKAIVHACNKIILGGRRSSPPVSRGALVGARGGRLVTRTTIDFVRSNSSVVLSTNDAILRVIPLLSHFGGVAIVAGDLRVIGTLSRLSGRRAVLVPNKAFHGGSTSFRKRLTRGTFRRFAFSGLFVNASNVSLGTNMAAFGRICAIDGTVYGTTHRIVLVTSSSGFNHGDPGMIYDLRDISGLVASTNVSPTFHRTLRRGKVSIVVAKRDGR